MLLNPLVLIEFSAIKEDTIQYFDIKIKANTIELVHKCIK